MKMTRMEYKQALILLEDWINYKSREISFQSKMVYPKSLRDLKKAREIFGLVIVRDSSEDVYGIYSNRNVMVNFDAICSSIHLDKDLEFDIDGKKTLFVYVVAMFKEWCFNSNQDAIGVLNATKLLKALIVGQQQYIDLKGKRVPNLEVFVSGYLDLVKLDSNNDSYIQ